MADETKPADDSKPTPTPKKTGGGWVDRVLEAISPDDLQTDEEKARYDEIKSGREDGSRRVVASDLTFLRTIYEKYADTSAPRYHVG